uniref:Uncharacterized protein n=1 Tax=Oryza sativa subsp. japonica TaxID=39947 RepID=Q2R0A6_ORYSJ|nr:hypothetical protein LOC_Os11g43220 [Oryza sativa Japonica Group]
MGEASVRVPASVVIEQWMEGLDWSMAAMVTVSSTRTEQNKKKTKFRLTEWKQLTE